MSTESDRREQNLKWAADIVATLEVVSEERERDSDGVLRVVKAVYKRKDS